MSFLFQSSRYFNPVFDEPFCPQFPALGIEVIFRIKKVFVWQTYFVEQCEDGNGGSLRKCFEKVSHLCLPGRFAITLTAGWRFKIHPGTFLMSNSIKVFEKNKNVILYARDRIGCCRNFPPVH